MTILVPQSKRERAAWEKQIEARLLLRYQQTWVDDKSRNKIGEKGRQEGFSWCDALDTVMETGMADWPYDSWISSRDQLQAQLYAEDSKYWANLLNIAAGDLGEALLDTEENGKKVQISATRLPFANRRNLWSLSSNVDAQAGKRGTRKLDEFALNKENRRLFGIAKPGTTWGGRFVIFSTHRGTHNYFNELITEVLHKGNPKKFSHHKVTLEDALRDGLLVKLKQRWRSIDPEDDRLLLTEDEYLQQVRNECSDQETFDQEYMCKPDDDASAFISYELIDACKYGAREDWERTVAELAKCENPLYVGVDIGRRRDITSIWVNEKVADVAFCRAQIDLVKMPFSTQESVLYPILDLPTVKRACLDDTGIGMQFAERAQQKFGKYRVEAVTFTPAVKEELAYPVKAAFEDRRIRIPDRPEVIGDLRGIRKETTAANNIRFTGERSETGHCDRFWACALALHAGKTANSTYRGELI